MNFVDIAFVAIAAVSVLVGALRGFVREAMALAGWIAAAVLVLNFAHELGERLRFGSISSGLGTALAALLIVVACVLCASLVGRLLRAAIAAVKLGGPDRALGALLGAARAAAISIMVTAVVLYTGMGNGPAWKASFAAQGLEAALRFVSPAVVPAVGRLVSAPGV
jgi:membrane protein required for colicin V production